MILWKLDFGSYCKVVGWGRGAGKLIAARVSAHGHPGSYERAHSAFLTGSQVILVLPGARAYPCVCSSLLGLKAAMLSPQRFLQVVHMGCYYRGLWSDWYHQRYTMQQLLRLFLPRKSWGDTQLHCWIWKGYFTGLFSPLLLLCLSLQNHFSLS